MVNSVRGPAPSHFVLAFARKARPGKEADSWDAELAPTTKHAKHASKNAMGETASLCGIMGNKTKATVLTSSVGTSCGSIYMELLLGVNTPGRQHRTIEHAGTQAWHTSSRAQQTPPKHACEVASAASVALALFFANGAASTCLRCPTPGRAGGRSSAGTSGLPGLLGGDVVGLQKAEWCIQTGS